MKIGISSCIVIALAAGVILGGCGDSGGMTQADIDAVKSHKATAPPSAEKMKPPSDFHSSIAPMGGAPSGPGAVPPGAAGTAGAGAGPAPSQGK